MINGELIKEKRRSMKLSQQDLASDLTNQTTISLLENENRAPSSKVLIAIAQRLNLDLNLVTGNISYPLISEKLHVIEQLTQRYQFKEALVSLDSLNTIAKDKFTKVDAIKSELLSAICHMWVSEDWDTAIFDLNRIFIDTQNLKGNSQIFAILANMETGVAYFQKGDIDKQGFFFENAYKQILAISVESETIFWYLFILNNLGKYFSKISSFTLSRKIAKVGIETAQKFSTTNFVEVFYYLLGFAEQAENGLNDEAADFYKRAICFAEFNSDQVVIKQAKLHLKNME